MIGPPDLGGPIIAIKHSFVRQPGNQLLSFAASHE